MAIKVRMCRKIGREIKKLIENSSREAVSLNKILRLVIMMKTNHSNKAEIIKEGHLIKTRNHLTVTRSHSMRIESHLIMRKNLSIMRGNLLVRIISNLVGLRNLLTG